MINSVRNTVLAILNKNNYGYVSPSDFNLLANNAQIEIFEGLFSDYNSSINAETLRLSGTEYADKRKAIEEEIESFLVSKALIHKSGNYFYTPSIITTGDAVYMINKITVYPLLLVQGLVSSVVVDELNDTSSDFVQSGVSVGDIVFNADSYSSAIVVGVVSGTQLTLSSNIFTALDQKYYIYNSKTFSVAEKVSNVNITMLNASNLTAPSVLYPSYSMIGQTIGCYPETINTYGAVVADYFRYPKTPKWTYSTLSSGDPVFNQSQPDYQDFELSSGLEVELVVKILSYLGITIREIQVAQFAIAKEQSLEENYGTKNI
jgi:hypothetical protein